MIPDGTPKLVVFLLIFFLTTWVVGKMWDRKPVPRDCVIEWDGRSNADICGW